MSEDVRAAMSPEEWERPQDLFDGYVDLTGGVIDVRLGGPAGVDDERERHALAAWLLDGETFGFTWEDVEALENASERLEYGRGSLSSLAARIAALLPPRTGEVRHGD